MTPFTKIGRWAGLALALGLSLAACAAPIVPTATPARAPATPSAVVVASPTTAPVATMTAAPTPAAPPSLILYVSQAAATDADPVWQAVQAFAQQSGWEAVAAPAAEWRDRLAQKPRVVVGAAGALPGEELNPLAASQPATYFISLGEAPAQTPPANVLVLGGAEARQDQAGFLAGLAAGFATRADRVGVVSDPASPEGRKYRNGFQSGVRYACPKCRLDLVDLAPGADAASASADAVKTAAYGADVLYIAPAPVQADILRAVLANGTWAIGAAPEVCEPLAAQKAAWLLACTAVQPAHTLTAALAAYGQGQPMTGVQPPALANGAISLQVYAAEALSALDLKDIAAAQSQLAARTLETGVDPLTGEAR